MKKPNSCVHLKNAIRDYAGVAGDDIRLGRAMANVVLGQMLPDGVVKGGSSLMFRYGGLVTRYTKDVDTARVMDVDTYVDRLNERLKVGWNGFTGRAVKVSPPEPEDVPPSYVMLPYDVKLSYNNKPWMTVRIEIGHNEIGDADEVELELSEDIARVFESLGFPRPAKVPVMKLTYQVAQKLHAVSEEGSERAHDLVDLQLIFGQSTVDLAETKLVCRRLFDYRRKQVWPPRVNKGSLWDDRYKAARANILGEVSLLPTVDEAIAWANDLIAKIDQA